MSINVVVSSPSIAATVAASGVAANVQPQQVVQAAVVGGPGPAGASGVTTIADADDVQLANVSDGDVLRYQNSRWRNYREDQLTDGGNY